MIFENKIFLKNLISDPIPTGSIAAFNRKFNSHVQSNRSYN